nr:ninja-family protein AFP1-like [Tanacetum cinerariifolium]
MGENSKKLDFVFKKLSGQKDPTGSDPEDDDELELNLGLSLGGRFGVDKNKGLVRSSSIAAILPAVTKTTNKAVHGEEGIIRIGDQILLSNESFRYSGPVMHRSGRIDDDVTHRIRTGWTGYAVRVRVLADHESSSKQGESGRIKNVDVDL